MTRDIAAKMNATFGEGTLKIPTALIREATAIVPGLDGQKMSKSYGNSVGLFEDEKVLKKKIMGITTDSTPMEAPKPTENSTILTFYKLVATPEEYAAMVQDFEKGGIGYGDFKKRLFEKLWAFFAEAREKRAEILAKKNYVEDVLQAGASKARLVARKTLDRVRHAVGLGA
jgi:tryptophanyl-tRNA synthetase